MAINVFIKRTVNDSMPFGRIKPFRHKLLIRGWVVLASSLTRVAEGWLQHLSHQLMPETRFACLREHL